MKLAETHLEVPIEPKKFDWTHTTVMPLESYHFNGALDYIWEQVGKLDLRMTEEAPFKLIKTDPEKAKQIIRELVEGVYEVGCLLAPHLPATSKNIVDTVLANKKPESMFPRIDAKA
jgi:methionyl-tRNA synthetase